MTHLQTQTHTQSSWKRVFFLKETEIWNIARPLKVICGPGVVHVTWSLSLTLMHTVRHFYLLIHYFAFQRFLLRWKFKPINLLDISLNFQKQRLPLPFRNIVNAQYLWRETVTETEKWHFQAHQRPRIRDLILKTSSGLSGGESRWKPLPWFRHT